MSSEEKKQTFKIILFDNVKVDRERKEKNHTIIARHHHTIENLEFMQGNKKNITWIKPTPLKDAKNGDLFPTSTSTSKK